MQALLKRFETPDEVRRFEKGRFEIICVGGLTLGRAIYEPGWRWSQHVGPSAATTLCEVEHVGLVISGRAVVAFANGDRVELEPGTVFYLPAVPHDSWVDGDEEYVSLHFSGAERYAT